MQAGKGTERGHCVVEPMLPVALQFIMAMVAHRLNAPMARRVDYLQEKVRVRREAFATGNGKSRLSFHARAAPPPSDHGKALTPDERRT